MSTDPNQSANTGMTARQKWVVVLGIIGTAILTAIATDVYGEAKAKLGFAFGISRPANLGAIKISITPESRQRDEHRFLGIGHTHFITKYSIRLESTAPPTGADRVTIQINSPGGSIVGLMIPPLLRAKDVKGNAIAEWRGVGHGEDAAQLVFDMDRPPPGSLATIPVFVESMSDFFNDEKLEISVNFQSGFERVICAPGKWTFPR